MTEPVNKDVGVRYPFRFNVSGRVELSGGSYDQNPTTTELDDAVQGGARQVVLTGKGERPMLGNFGLGAGRYLFMPIESLAMAMLQEDVRDQFSWWGRAELASANPRLDTLDGALTMNLTLRHRDDIANQVSKFTIRGLG